MGSKKSGLGSKKRGIPGENHKNLIFQRAPDTKIAVEVAPPDSPFENTAHLLCSASASGASGAENAGEDGEGPEGVQNGSDTWTKRHTEASFEYIFGYFHLGSFCWIY